jgi:hypothetical protein
LLSPLQINGGLTETMAVLPGSPAIDARDSAGAPDWDQGGPGYPRIVNDIIDTGAFEEQSTAPCPPLRAGTSCPTLPGDARISAARMQ